MNIDVHISAPDISAAIQALAASLTRLPMPSAEPLPELFPKKAKKAAAPEHIAEPVIVDTVTVEPTPTIEFMSMEALRAELLPLAKGGKRDAIKGLLASDRYNVPDSTKLLPEQRAPFLAEARAL